MKNKITYALTYKGWPINTVKSRSLGAYTAILNSIHSQISALLSHHSDYSFSIPASRPVYEIFGSRTWNQEVSEFVQEAKRKLATTAWGNHRQLAYCWVRKSVIVAKNTTMFTLRLNSFTDALERFQQKDIPDYGDAPKALGRAYRRLP